MAYGTDEQRARWRKTAQDKYDRGVIASGKMPLRLLTEPERSALSLGKLRAKQARQRAKIKGDPVRSAKRRQWVREAKRRQMLTPEGRERHRLTVRKAVQRLRMLRPAYAAQWERDDKGRWFRASQSSDGTITRAFLKELEIDQICPYCHGPITDANRVFDHVEPICRDGEHSARNLVSCCETCNSAKGKLRLIEFLLRRAEIS
jgi:5-methylcytosine-specific restriction endonuclease McrA